MPNDSAERLLGEEGGKRLLQQVLDTWVVPEIKRRQTTGAAEKPYQLSRAQVLFDPLKPHIVRLNDEVRLRAQVRLNKGQSVQKGDPVYASYLAGVEDVELIDDELDCGHISLLLVNDKWMISWSGRYNSNRISELSRMAAEFLATAGDSFLNGRSRVFVECLFASAELMAKAIMISWPDKILQEAKKHGVVSSRFNQRAANGSINAEFAGLLNRLGRLRGSARYGDQSFALNDEDQDTLLALAIRMFDFLERTRPRPRF